MKKINPNFNTLNKDNLLNYFLGKLSFRFFKLNISHYLPLLLTLFLFHSCTSTMTDTFPNYTGNDLGLTYSPEQSTFKVWSPTADFMTLHIHNANDGDIDENLIPESTHPMEKDENGVFVVTLEGDLEGQFYTFQIQKDGKMLAPVPDPYAIATGVNGHRAMVVDLKKTNPIGWENDQKPPLKNPTDIIIYELHVRDLSSHPNSNIQNSGLFLGLTETGTKSADGHATGIDHIKELGATHIHLLPVYDFSPNSIDEKNPTERFNWGYDPQNYNVPEGAYSSNPYDGRVRIKEFKQMVKTLHDNDLRVIMDVVYNHTGETEKSNFNQLMPDYYYRKNEDGSFSNASGCGNETASEQFMVRKFMVESLTYWAKEYHIDGFRVDLMGIHDIETMNIISEELHKIDPTIFIYGEGWTAGDSPLPLEKRAVKAHGKQLKNIAVFSDDLRDGLKGSVFNHEEKGFVSGKKGMEESIKFGVVASTDHPQVDYKAVNYSDTSWSSSPSQTISYVSCHDNHTLFDRLQISNKKDDETTRLKMHRLANSIVLTSQGVPFLHAGTELARTKQGVENSYQHPDSINQIDWSRKTDYYDHFKYYQKLVDLRKAHPAFRMPTTKMIQKHLRFFENLPEGVVAYQISDYANGDTWKNIIVIYNGNPETVNLNLANGKWQIQWLGEKSNMTKRISSTDGHNIKVEEISCYILFQN